MRRWALIGVLSCLGCGGASLEYIPKQEASGPVRARPADQVDVFTSGAPKRAYTEVGVIASQQEPGSNDRPADLIAKMRAFAGEHGCDGLMDFTSNDSVSETMLQPGGASRVYTLSGYRASCIVYAAGSAPSVQAAAPAPAAAAAPAPTTCMPNATQLCFGPAGCRGGQSCAADGRSWSLCDCGNQPPPSAAEP
jgi:hypothetical protein